MWFIRSGCVCAVASRARPRIMGPVFMHHREASHLLKYGGARSGVINTSRNEEGRMYVWPAIVKSWCDHAIKTIACPSHRPLVLYMYMRGPQDMIQWCVAVVWCICADNKQFSSTVIFVDLRPIVVIEQEWKVARGYVVKIDWASLTNSRFFNSR